MGATDLMLRLMEAHVRLPDLTLANEMQAIRTVAHDLSGTATVELADGRHVTAVEIQSAYLDVVRSHVGGIIEPTAEVESILDLWERGIRAVAEDASHLVDTELDWAIKRRLIARYQERLGCSLGDPRLARLELAFHDVSPERGLYHRLVGQGLIATVVDDAAIESARTVAPQTTRARLRGAFVEAASTSGQDYTVDWVHLKAHRGE
ncbi:hypothetical protein GCM10025876_36290 [Demequina litorisediminis]|uniref:Uncharacterized protein n=1 Tax=Demequina litorisediminis TaxID=1849022 RepID=A0ABQ6IJD6_9MICO|nr:hypothetical protein GCM10025876_36290 [Demequina litorisediminis]